MTTPKSAKGEVQAVARWTPYTSFRSNGERAECYPDPSGNYALYTELATALAARDAAQHALTGTERLWEESKAYAKTLKTRAEAAEQALEIARAFNKKWELWAERVAPYLPENFQDTQG